VSAEIYSTYFLYYLKVRESCPASGWREAAICVQHSFAKTQSGNQNNSFWMQIAIFANKNTKNDNCIKISSAPVLHILLIFDQKW